MREFCKKIPLEFHISDYKLIFVFLFPICEILQTKIKQKYLKAYYEFFLIFATYLSYLFSLIFLIIINLRTSNHKIGKEKKEISNDNDNIDIKTKGIFNSEVQKTARKKSIKSIIYIIILSGINMCYSHFNFESFIDKRTIGTSYKILLFFLLSHFILKYDYGKHHYITFGLNTITLIIKYAVSIVESKSQEYVGKHIWYYLIYALSFCLLFTIGKYYMDNYYQTPYFIIFFVGIIIGPILIIIALIKYLAGYESQIFAGFRDNVNTTKNVFLFLGDIITQFGMYLGLWITVYYFTPCHTIVSENIMEICYYIIDFKTNQDFWKDKNVNLNIYFFPYIHIINFFCSLVFNEILVLKFCGLDYYTRLNIQKRENSDSKKMLRSESIETISSSNIND